MPIHVRKLKLITFTIDLVAYECQVSAWQIVNNTPVGEKLYTFCPDGEMQEEADPAFALELTLFADWRAAGISEFLQTNDGLVADFVLDHHPDIALEHVRWTGEVTIRTPSVGGEIRTNETQTVTLQCVGTPLFARVP